MTVLRPFNTYGPHQSTRAVTATVITQALAGETLLLGELGTRRDLTFVSDTVAGFIAAAESDAAVGRTVHLGTGHDVSVAELVAVVGELLGRRLAVEVDEARLRPPLSEVRRLVSNPALAHELIGWSPKVDLGAGLSATIGWIESNMSRFRIGEYSR